MAAAHTCERARAKESELESEREFILCIYQVDLRGDLMVGDVAKMSNSRCHPTALVAAHFGSSSAMAAN